MSQLKRKVNILSLDGGGIRGLAQLRYLEALEAKTGKQCHQLFDVIVGTSTGGLIAILLSIPGKSGQVMTATRVKDLYLNNGRRIFPKSVLSWSMHLLLLALLSIMLLLLKSYSPSVSLESDDSNGLWILRGVLLILYTILLCYFISRVYKFFDSAQYSEKGLLNVISDNFDTNTTLKDALTYVGVVVTDIHYDKPIVLNSYRAKMFPEDYRHNVKISEAARATSAAPTYFKPVKLRNSQAHNAHEHNVPSSPTWRSADRPYYRRNKLDLEDGGTSSNNPAKLAIKLAKSILHKNKIYDYEHQLLSIGTGTLSGHQDDPTKYKPTSFMTRCFYKGCARRDGGLDNVMLRLLIQDPFRVSLKAYNTHREVEEKFRKKGSGYEYFRLQFKIDDHQLAGMDDCSTGNMKSLIVTADEAIKHSSERLEKMFKVFGREQGNLFQEFKMSPDNQPSQYQ